MSANENEKPKNCGECQRFFRDPERKGHGWCDNWGGVDLTENCVCHPNYGRKRKGGEE